MFCWIATSFARDAELEQYMDMSLEELFNLDVVTASRSSQSLRKAPGTIFVVTQAEIRERGLASLSDVLGDLPSVDYHPSSDVVNYNHFTFRGVFGNNKFLVLRDGVRVSSPTGEEMPIAQNFSLQNVKQIEVAYGPASALYGADAFTGVVNIISDDRGGGSVQFEFGEDGHRSWRFDYGGKLSDTIRFYLGAFDMQSDGYDLAASYPNEYRLRDLVTFGGEVYLESSDRAEPRFPLSSSGFHLGVRSDAFSLSYRANSLRHSLATAASPDFIDYGKSPDWETKLETLAGSYVFDFGGNGHSRLQASYSLYEVDPQSKFSNVFVNYENGYKYAKSQRADIGQQFEFDLSEQGILTLGYALESFKSIPITADLPTPYQTGKPASGQGLSFPGTNGEIEIPVFEADWENYGIFSQWQVSLGNGYDLTLGARFDDSSSYGSVFTPRAGLVWAPSDDRSIKLLYGEAFLAPSPNNAYRFFGSFAFEREDGLYQSFFFHLPNPDLQPEEMRTLELSGSRRFGDKLNANASLFYEEVENLIQPVFYPGVNSEFLDGSVIESVEINENVGSIEAFGFDLGLTYRESFGEHKWKLWGNLSYIDGDLRQPGIVTDLPYTASFKLKIGATYRYRDFYISPTVYRIGDSNSSELGSAIGFETDAFTIANMHIGYDGLGDGVSLYLKVANLFDTRYRVPGSGDITVFDAAPQNGRQMILGLRYDF